MQLKISCTSKKEKLKKRLLKKPKDFSFKELVTLLDGLGFVELQKGATSGSRVSFLNEKNRLSINLHKPHPRNILKKYQIEQIIDVLKTNKLIWVIF